MSPTSPLTHNRGGGNLASNEATPHTKADKAVSYKYRPHPRHVERGTAVPKVADEHVGINGKIALAITRIVGTMWCAYVFAILALISLPEAVRSGIATTVAWIAQTFLQLVLLSIIMVGQDVAAKAADKRADSTFKDAEAILAEAIEVQKHLAEQDQVLTQIIQAHRTGKD